MKHHSELINYLIEKFNLKSYLEIGTYNRDHNFNLIQVPVKSCVDPDPAAQADYVMTSDAFFARKSKDKRRYDLIFIDGLHHEDQVKKDFENALKCLNKKGFIVLHDCNPPTEATTCVPRGKQREWCGDVYKFASKLGNRTGIDYITVDFDYGCTVVWKDRTITTPCEVITDPIPWNDFTKNRHRWLRLVSVENFINKIIPQFKTPA